MALSDMRALIRSFSEEAAKNNKVARNTYAGLLMDAFQRFADNAVDPEAAALVVAGLQGEVRKGKGTLLDIKQNVIKTILETAK